MIIEPKPVVRICANCGVRHNEAVYSTIPERLFWCSTECSIAYYRPQLVTTGNDRPVPLGLRIHPA